jgi:hypothetical protein
MVCNARMFFKVRDYHAFHFHGTNGFAGAKVGRRRVLTFAYLKAVSYEKKALRLEIFPATGALIAGGS